MSAGALAARRPPRILAGVRFSAFLLAFLLPACSPELEPIGSTEAVNDTTSASSTSDPFPGCVYEPVPTCSVPVEGDFCAYVGDLLGKLKVPAPYAGFVLADCAAGEPPCYVCWRAQHYCSQLADEVSSCLGAIEECLCVAAAIG